MTSASDALRKAGGLCISQTIVQHCPHAAKRTCCSSTFHSPPPSPPSSEPAADDQPVCKPLVTWLCDRLHCTPAELGERLTNPQRRREIIEVLRDSYLLTTHLKPEWRNIRVICHDLTRRGARFLPAYGGFMGVKVDQHYYIRHRIKLDHVDLPCVAEQGPSGRRSYFPLEVLSILL